MPEIEKEIPSDAELWKYFLELRSMTAFQWAYMSVEENKQCYHELLYRSILSLNKTGSLEFITIACDWIFKSLKRLNQLPRTDHFWVGTNKRPTIFKLQEFCLLLLNKSSRDENPLCTLACLSVFRSASDFGQEHWMGLRRLDQLDIAWPIHAALITNLNAAPIEKDLAGFLQEADMVLQAKPLLNSIKEKGDGLIPAWVDKVTDYLGS